MKINYLVGDATSPQVEGEKFIVHVCNDIGAWGAGFVLALSKRWKEPEEAYHKWHESGKNFCLGKIQQVRVESDISIINMIGQHKIRSFDYIPVRYEAIKEGLIEVAKLAKEQQASVHMPRIGCGLAGGEWSKIELILEETLSNEGVQTYVYDFDG